MNCIAIDMGASNVRIMLGRISGEGIEYDEMYRFSNDIVLKEGQECWDLDHILENIIRGINRAFEVESEIHSLGVDSWGVDFVLLDSEGEVIGQPVAYRDKRTEGMEEKWMEYMSRAETFRRTGINFYPFNSLFQLLSLKNGVEIARARQLVFLPSYVSSKLCGNIINEQTISSTSQLLNAGSGTWDPEILSMLDIPAGVMGDICLPGTILGSVNHAELDLPGCRVTAVCAHDTASAVVSVPFENESSVFISTGTWCIVGMELDQPILSGDALENGFTNERGYQGSFRFLKNIVGLWLVQGLIKSLPVSEDYAEIESLALGYSGDSLIIDPGDPLFYNPENMKEAFDEYFRKTDQALPSEPGGYFRSAYDSLIHSFLDHIELIEKMTGRKIDTIHLIGGGCQSEYLTKQTAIICNRRVVSGPVEAAAIGNMLVQSLALGILPDLQAARKLVRNSPLIREI